MAEGDKKGPDKNRINEKQRFSYIGFEVFPGKPKDLFKNDSERQKLVNGVLSKRESEETLRDDCKLLEERVSLGERIVMGVASLAILLALVLPWYSAYMEVTVEAEPVASAVEEPTDMALAVADSLAGPDSILGEAVPNEVPEDLAAGAVEAVEAVEGVIGDTSLLAEAGAAEQGRTTHAGERANEQIITGHTARVAKAKDYTYLSGFGVFGALGSVGGPVFSSGIVLVLTGILMLLYGVLCVALPVINLYGIFGLKGSPDDVALKLKKYLKLNWLPLILFVAAMILSFVGAEYGFDTSESFTSLGGAYGVGVFMESLSWGVFVALAASLLVAVKGIEI